MFLIFIKYIVLIIFILAFIFIGVSGCILNLSNHNRYEKKEDIINE